MIKKNKTTKRNELSVRYFQENKLVHERVEACSWLHVMYYTLFGKLICFFFTRFSLMSRLHAWYQCSRLSRSNINQFIKKHEIEMHDFVGRADEFKSFNDFFCRQLRPGARMIDPSSDAVVCPGDGKLLVSNDIAQDILFFVKNERFNLSSFLKDEALVQEFQHATMVLLRLAPYDYHRFHFPCDAYVSAPRYIPGRYESVNPLVYRAGVQPLTENLRYIISMRSDLFGHVLMIPVGAAMVGSVFFTYDSETFCKKGSEAGYFQFGGSSVVLLFKAKTMVIKKQFLQHSLQGFETAVKMGQKITE